jgi:hypothetical protein
VGSCVTRSVDGGQGLGVGRNRCARPWGPQSVSGRRAGHRLLTAPDMVKLGELSEGADVETGPIGRPGKPGLVEGLTGPRSPLS